MILGKLLGAGSSRRSGKVIDGQHPALANAATNGEALKPDLLPDDQCRHHGPHQTNILVAVRGWSVDREVVSLACKVATEKRGQVFAVYGIEVPRAKAIDDEMPQQTEKAHEVLERAAGVAQKAGVAIDKEIVQSRDFGHSLVDEAEAHECDLLIIGVPYQLGVAGQIEGLDALTYVLQNAPCKVWVVRDRRIDPVATPPESPANTLVAPRAPAATRP